MLYSQYETMKLALQPLSHFLTRSITVLNTWDALFPQLSILNNYHQAKFSLTNNLIKDYPKMPWGLKPIVDTNGVTHDIKEEVVISKTFCEFKLFSLTGVKNRPALFMVAPLSGHYATLLRDTLQKFLQDFDVYITDWVNARDIPTEEGEFGFEDYVSYVIEFSKYIKDKHKQVNVLAVCQPTVPVAVASAYLSKNEPEYKFDNVILMGGPLDTRISPTQVNEYAFKNSLDWFERNVIKTVPIYFKGYGRKVYPGFLQHMGFLSMNMKRHTQAHIEFFNHLLIGADLDAKKHEEFYNEYNAVMDLPAKYYLETLAHVFIDQSLAKDKMELFGQKISMSDITEGRYLLLEGEFDDISGPGQTHAAYDMLSSLSENNKQKYLAEKVGHYGIFSGSGFRNNIYPMIKSFILNENVPLNKKGDIVHIEKFQKTELKNDIVEKEVVQSKVQPVPEIKKAEKKVVNSSPKNTASQKKYGIVKLDENKKSNEAKVDVKAPLENVEKSKVTKSPRFPKGKEGETKLNPAIESKSVDLNLSKEDNVSSSKTENLNKEIVKEDKTD